MIFNKKEKKPTLVKLSENSITFIKTVIVPELNITKPISSSEICQIEDWIYALEDMQYDDNGNEVNLDLSTKTKISNAQVLLSELMAIWGGDNTIEDLVDLNTRIGLL